MRLVGRGRSKPPLPGVTGWGGVRGAAASVGFTGVVRLSRRSCSGVVGLLSLEPGGRGPWLLGRACTLCTAGLGDGHGVPGWARGPRFPACERLACSLHQRSPSSDRRGRAPRRHGT